MFKFLLPAILLLGSVIFGVETLLPPTPCGDTTAQCLAKDLLATNSPFVTPIGPSPVVDVNSASYLTYYNGVYQQKGFGTTAFFRANTYDYSYPIYEIKKTAVLGTDYTVQSTVKCTAYNKCYLEGTGIGDISNMPFPKTASADPGTDHHLVVIDSKGGKIYELYGAQNVGGVWSAQHGTVITIGSLGTKDKDPLTYCSRASCIPIVATVVRKEELMKDKAINHVLGIAVPGAHCKVGNGSNSCTTKDIVYPAGNSDGIILNGGALPEGARLQLNMTPAEIDSQSWTPETKIIAKALQTYGAVVVDQAGAIAIQLENIKVSEGTDWNTLLGYDIRSAVQNIPISRFRVVETPIAGSVVVPPIATTTPTSTPPEATTTPTTTPPIISPTSTPTSTPPATTTPSTPWWKKVFKRK